MQEASIRVMLRAAQSAQLPIELHAHHEEQRVAKKEQAEGSSGKVEKRARFQTVAWAGEGYS